MVFVDSNIPMYLVGGEHPNRALARGYLEKLISGGRRFATDAEVFQEILHRYRAIGRDSRIPLAWDALAAIVDETFPVDRRDVEAAKGILLAHAELSARDALHAALMRKHRIRAILSFDRAFDGLAGIERIG